MAANLKAGGIGLLLGLVLAGAVAAHEADTPEEGDAAPVKTGMVAIPAEPAALAAGWSAYAAPDVLGGLGTPALLAALAPGPAAGAGAVRPPGGRGAFVSAAAGWTSAPEEGERYGFAAGARGVGLRRAGQLDAYAAEVDAGQTPAADFVQVAGLYQTGPLGVGAGFRLASHAYGAPWDAYRVAGSEADKIFDFGLAYVIRGARVGVAYRALGSRELAADLAAGAGFDAVGGLPLGFSTEWHFPAERGGVSYGGLGASWALPQGIEARAGVVAARRRATGTAGLGYAPGRWRVDYGLQAADGGAITHGAAVSWGPKALRPR